MLKRLVGAAVLVSVSILGTPCFGGLKTDATLMVLGQGADSLSTFYALNRCPTCREQNPLGVEGTMVAKVAFTGGIVLLCREMRKSGHGRTARFMAVGVAVGGMVLAVRNMKRF